MQCFLLQHNMIYTNNKQKIITSWCINHLSVRRVILASSNHVMGGYKDDPTYGPSSIYPYSDPSVGTVPLNPQQIESSGDAVAYAAAKLAGERCAMTLGELYGDTTAFKLYPYCYCMVKTFDCFFALHFLTHGSSPLCRRGSEADYTEAPSLV